MYGIEGLLLGRTLGGRYRVEAVVGRGGMGAVYRATDERLDRPVAVKVIAAPGVEPSEHERLRARFHREARAAAGLHHPNVVSVFDFGTDPDLLLDFLVMELLRGEDLAARLARTGPPPRAGALAILHQAARGLAAGHRAGLVHRDVKPGNLFLEPGDGPSHPHVRVLDFGIVQLSPEEATSTQLTEVGRSPYSPAYASPEQVRGDPRITPAADVFSLGAVGYYLLTGARCFTASEPKWMAREVADALDRLEERAPGLDPAVGAALRRALASDPADRFAEAGAFADALCGGGAGGHPHARPAAHCAEEDDDRTQVLPEAPRALTGTPQHRWRESDATEMHAPVVEKTPPPVRRREPTEPPPARPAADHGPPEIVPFVPPSFDRPRPAPVPGGEDAPRRPGRARRFFRALGTFVVTLLSMVLFAGAWLGAVAGAIDQDQALFFGGAVATLFATPWAVHRLTGRRGRLGWEIFGAMAASALAVYLSVRSEADPVVGLAGAFGLQVIFAWAFARLTRRRRPEEEPAEG